MKITLSILFVCAFWYVFDRKIDVNGDNARYYILGKALSQGKYADIQTPGEPQHTQYTPIFPAVISVCVKIWGEKAFIAVKVLNGLFLWGAIMLWMSIIGNFINDKRILWFMGLILVFNPLLLRQATIMMSETIFLFLLVFAIFCGYGINKKYALIPFIVLGLVLYYTRSIGIAFCGAVVLSFINFKDYKKAAICCFSFICGILPWMLQDSVVSKQPFLKNPYDPSAGTMGIIDILTRMGDNLWSYLTVHIPALILPGINLHWITALLVVSVIIYGIWNQWFLIYYSACLLFICCIWPEQWTCIRFVHSLAPIAVYGFVFGLYRLKLHYLAVISICACLFALPAHAKQAEIGYSPGWNNYFEAGDWSRQNTDFEAVFVARKPNLFHLFSGKKVVCYPWEKDVDKMWAFIKDYDYLVLENVGYGQTLKYIIPLIQAKNEHFEVVLAIGEPKTFVVKIKK